MLVTKALASYSFDRVVIQDRLGRVGPGISLRRREDRLYKSRRQVGLLVRDRWGSEGILKWEIL